MLVDCIRSVGDALDASDIAVTVEHVEIVILPGAGHARDIGAKGFPEIFDPARL